MKPHWEKIYAEKQPEAVSWFQPKAELSLRLIKDANIQKTDAIIDAGGGASRLADGLLEQGYGDITVVDISAKALEVAQQRLGARAGAVKWVEDDITQAQLPENRFALWHDRAAFHFLTKQEDRRKYTEAVRGALLPRGHVIIATFGLDGPEKCSGLNIVRYSPESLLSELGGGFELVDTLYESHHTPSGAVQKFVYCRLRLLANFC